jgi:hypothetical protein
MLNRIRHEAVSYEIFIWKYTNMFVIHLLSAGVKSCDDCHTYVLTRTKTESISCRSITTILRNVNK